MTFVRNHAKGIVACDFFVVATATFPFLYVFVIMEIGTLRILHHNVTAHPSAEWTLQQFREALPGEHGYEYVIHDRDRIYSSGLDRAVHEMGVWPENRICLIQKVFGSDRDNVVLPCRESSIPSDSF